MERREHWEQVYTLKKPEEVSWYQLKPSPSIEWILEAFPNKDANVIDIGGGTSSLVKYLLDEGFKNPAILDISSAALEKSKTLMGNHSYSVEWIVSDITNFSPSRKFDLWHDRAVFHFLVRAEDRRLYIDSLKKATHIGGKILLATFSLLGPTKCSGLDVIRFDAKMLANELGPSFKLIKNEDIAHKTPSANTQSFIYCFFERILP
jgi:SAM-dependent methyltransferase